MKEEPLWPAGCDSVDRAPADDTRRYLGGKDQYPSSSLVVPGHCYPSYTRMAVAVTSGGGFYEAALTVDVQALYTCVG